jgi:hypothetical protein
MATIIGRSEEIAISTNGSSYTAIGHVMSVTPSFSHALADETTNDSGGWEESKYADSNLSLSIDGKFNSSDAGQALLIAAATGKLTYYFRFRMQTAGGEYQYIFQGNVESFQGGGGATGEVQPFSASVKSNGTVTISTQ